jgi:DNA-binding Xre family transcriptional regulator
MLSPEEIKEKLKDRVVKVVAEETGLHENTVRKMKKGAFETPEYETVRRLSEYLETS